MTENAFNDFFQAEAKMFLLATVRIALSEDGPDLTSMGLFEQDDIATAQIIAKEDTVISGLPLINIGKTGCIRFQTVILYQYIAEIGHTVF